MQKSENIPSINIIGSEAIGRGETPVANLRFELLERLADRVVRDAEDLAARIRKEAESEAARLIEDANRLAQGIVDKAQKQSETAAIDEAEAATMLQQAKQRAAVIEAEATKDVGQARLKIKEEIERNLIEIVKKIHGELQPSLDHLVERAKTLKEEVRAVTNTKGDEAASRPEPPALIGAVCEAVNELHRKPEGAIGSTDARESGHSTGGRTGSVEASVAAESVATETALPKKDPELWEGKIEIDIAPPVKITRLLGVTRYLENTLDIKVLKTSGSSNSGIAMIISLDKPLPLLNLLREIPTVEEAKMVEGQKQSSNTEQSDVKKISVILGRNAA